MSQTVIVFQDESILAASGKEGPKPQIQYIHKIELTGYGDPFTRWKSGLMQLKDQAEVELRKVRLVLPSSMCQVKCMRLPYAKNKELQAMVKREMQESFRSEIMDYGVIDSDAKSGVSLVGASVEKDVLGQFLGMCRETGIDVGSVTAPMEAIQRVIAEQKAGSGRTAIYLFFEEEGLTSVLMEKGQYKYSGRSRLFAEPGTLDFGTEIVRNISGILQFHTASKSEEQITDIYYTGCDSEDFAVSVAELGGMNLNVHPFGELRGVRMPAGERTADWSLCIGGMMYGMRGRHSINLLDAYEDETPDKVKKTSVWKHVLPVAAIFAVCAVIFAGIEVWNLSLMHKISEVDDWILDTAGTEEYLQASTAKKEAERVEQTVREIEGLKSRLATYPEMNAQVLARIEAAGGGIALKVRGYDTATGVLTFDASSREVIDIPGYIMNLEGTGLFYKVEYTGYTYEDGVYTLSILCTMDSAQTGGDVQ